MAWFNLGKALDKKGWSMGRFAREMNVRPQAVTRYFNPRFDPNASTLLHWSRVLGCGIDDLLDPALDEERKLMPRPKTAMKYKKKKIVARKKPRR